VELTGNIWLSLHLVWRWVLFAAAVLAVGKALVGWLGKQPWGAWDDRLGQIYTIAMDVQLLLGLILWFVGPFRIVDAGTLMSVPLARFHLVEHPLILLVALALAHIGRSRARKAESDVVKHRTAFIFYLLSFLLLVLIFILWRSFR
jgi:hypothetical protein